MFMRRTVFLTIAASLLLTQGAFAAGTAGLWTVTTIWQFGVSRVPPALVALARQQGLATPVNGQPFVHHICMTSYEADGSQPLHLNSRELDCVNRVVGQRRSQMVLETICHGPQEGVGRALITWRGNRHFEGTSDFKGRLRGDPARIGASFSADWVGEDCRGVRAFLPQNN
jgi:Protein of unknown function (DUF3617)